MFPIVVGLLLANLQDVPGYAIRLVCFLEKESNRRRVYTGIRVRWWNFEGAIVVIEGLAQVMFVLRVGAPSILIGAPKNAQGFAVCGIFRHQSFENILGATRRSHLSQGQSHPLLEPVVIRMIIDCCASCIISGEKFPSGERALYKGTDGFDVIHPFGAA